MKRYRLFHRVLKQFKDLSANSAQEACQEAGWLIGDTWVREETRGQYANGWRNVTRINEGVRHDGTEKRRKT